MPNIHTIHTWITSHLHTFEFYSTLGWILISTLEQIQ